MAKEPEAAAAAESETQPSGKKKLPLLLLAVIGGLAVGGGTGAVVLGPMAAGMLGFTGAPAATDDHAAEEGHGDDGGHGDEGGHGEEGGAAGGASPIVHTLDNLVLNPAGTGGARFLLLTVTFEAGSTESGAALQGRDAELRDVVLTTLGRKSVDELVDVGGREAIKTELVDAVNERFGQRTVVRLYFPQYVVQ